MKKSNAIVIVLTGSAIVLAAMGCWFCWHCPSRIYPPHGLFWRQLAWNGVGLAVFAGAWLAGWRRLLKAAPWLMAAWLVAITAAQFFHPVCGAHKWLSFGPLRVNVAMCFMPVFALFAAWLRDRKRLRPWMCWAVLSLSAAWAVWHVAGDGGRMERLAAFFNPRDYWMQDRMYMSRQLLAAFGASRWFGDAGRSLGLLPCPESDGMMSASALMFGKWFPAVLVGIFTVVGASLTLLWKGTGDTAKRMFAILFGLWLIVPAAYCFLHSLALLPVAGMSPALAGYGGTAVVMAWFGIGILSAMVGRCAPESGCDTGTRIGVMAVLGICGAWIGIAVLGVGVLVLRCLSVEAENLKFAEPRPSDMEFGEFGLVPKRGRILAADGSPLAYTVRS
ncbi:MAG: FtsW/RodA/SpoVE family cell cycle protein [Kiritimatiellae bacterium]|nr:FtsW/RodA/SpoVE family cell cycle protein [Kiritimatiellia bacterium]